MPSGAKQWWFLGGTCAGKKTAIRFAVASPTFLREIGIVGTAESAWMNDGAKPIPAFSEIEADNLLVRWQWGRELHMPNDARIVVVRTRPEIRHERAKVREEHCRWTLATMRDEHMRLLALIDALSVQMDTVPVYLNGEEMEVVS